MSFASQLVTRGQTLLSPSRRPVGGGIKRTFDFAAACVAIITLLPLFLACCLLIAVTSPGPILFCHRRLGFGGREFCCLKFRTMQVDAERRLKDYLARNLEARQEWKAHHKLKNDPRITPVGHFLTPYQPRRIAAALQCAGRTHEHRGAATDRRSRS